MIEAFTLLCVVNANDAAHYSDYRLMVISISQLQLSHPLILRTRNAREYYPPSVIHLDSVIESEEEPQVTTIRPTHNDDSFFDLGSSSDDWNAESLEHFGQDRPEPVNLQFSGGYKPTVVSRMHNDGNVEEHDGFYDMVLNILETFHSAAETEARQSRQRMAHRNAADRMMIFN